MKAKVSIIVPVYNMEQYLPRCMESLLRQTMKELQIILVDDGSTDQSAALCDRYAAQDERVLSVHQKNQGPGMARNTGLTYAKGEFIGFVDSDDYVLPEMFERLYEKAAELGADMALSGMRQVGGNLFEGNGEKEICCFQKQEIFWGSTSWKQLLLGTVGSLPHEEQDSSYNFSVCKNIYSRKIIKENNILFESEKKEYLEEDIFFALDFIPYIKLAVGVPGAFYCYVRKESSRSRSYQGDPFKRAKKLALEICKRLKQIMPEAEFQIYTDRMFQARARVAIVEKIRYARECGIEKRVLYGTLKEVCRDEELSGTLRRYPWYKLPVKQALFACAMRYRMVRALYLLTWLKER